MAHESLGQRAWRAARRCANAGLLLVLAAGAPACAPEREDDLHGMILEVRSEVPWANDPELRARVRTVLDATCAHLDLDPTLLYGMTLRIEDGGIPCGSIANARGCTWRDDGVIAISTLAWTSLQGLAPCLEDTPLPHELLHVKIGDSRHVDERWDAASYWAPLWSRLSRADCSGDGPAAIWGL